MDTNDPYFWPGEEELQVWMYDDTGIKTIPHGYIKGSFYESHLANIGNVKDKGEKGKVNWNESVLQQMAESTLASGVIFFFVRVITTTSLDDGLSAEVQGKYEKIAQEHDYLGNKAEERVTGAGDYDRGVASGIRMVMEHGPYV